MFLRFLVLLFVFSLKRNEDKNIFSVFKIYNALRKIAAVVLFFCHWFLLPFRATDGENDDSTKTCLNVMFAVFSADDIIFAKSSFVWNVWKFYKVNSFECIFSLKFYTIELKNNWILRSKKVLLWYVANEFFRLAQNIKFIYVFDVEKFY